MRHDALLLQVMLTGMLATLAPRPAAASAVAQKLTVREAVPQARFVLVVEPARPPTRQVVKRFPYTDRRTQQPRSLEVTRVLHRFKVVQVLRAQKGGPRVGATVDVLDGNAPMHEAVQVSMKTSSSWPILILPQLEGQVVAVTGGRYVLLLGGHDPQDRHYLGIGGLGLLPVALQAEVTRLLTAAPR